MVRAALTKYHTRGLRIIEVEKAHLGDLPAIVDQVRSEPFQFLIYCDDLTFEDGEREYSGLKTVLDGTLEEFGSNILVVCTSNRRHLVSEPMSDNQHATVINGEIHQGDAIEERVSLSDRFGLWLSFYPYPQDIYVAIVKYWYNELGQDMQLPEFSRSHGSGSQSLCHRARWPWRSCGSSICHRFNGQTTSQSEGIICVELFANRLLW